MMSDEDQRRIDDDYNVVNHYYRAKMMHPNICLLYTSPSPRDATLSRMPSSA